MVLRDYYGKNSILQLCFYVTLYESFGWWRGTQLRKIHNSEEYNELYNLFIMEALGRNALWIDRFLGYRAAIFYYWALIGRT